MFEDDSLVADHTPDPFEFVRINGRPVSTPAPLEDQRVSTVLTPQEPVAAPAPAPAPTPAAPAAAPATPDPGFLTKHLANPWVSIPLAAGMAAAGLGRPWWQRAAGLGTSGLELGLGAEKANYQREKEAALAGSLNKLAQTTVPTNVTKTGVNPATASFSMPDQGNIEDQRVSQVWGGNEPLAPAEKTPSYSTTENQPLLTPQEQQYVTAMANSGYPQEAARVLGAKIIKTPTTPHVFGSPETGYHSIDQTGKVTQVAPGVGKADAWKAYEVNLGDKMETGIMNSSTGEKKNVEVKAIGSKPLDPAQKAVDDARVKQLNASAALSNQHINESAARASRLAALTKAANDPKTATEKLTTELGVLIRGQKQAEAKAESSDDPLDKQDAVEWADAVRVARRALANRRTDANPDAALPKGIPQGSVYMGTVKDGKDKGKPVYQVPGKDKPQIFDK